jgi:hypothetical protein
MAGENDGVKVKFGAEIAELLSKLTQAGDKVSDTTGKMKQNLESLNVGFLKITAGLAAVAAVVSGGSALKGMIDDTIKADGETAKFARTLGITGERAGGLRESLEDVGVTQEDYLGVFQKFSRQLKNNEDGLKSYGLVTRDANGNLRDTQTLIREAGAITEQYKQGVDRNIVSMELFGRSGADLSKIMKVTEASIQANIVKNRELNLTLTTEGLAANKAYKLAIKDVDDVLEGTRRTIASAFIPRFTELAEKFASFGPTIIEFTETFVNSFMTIRDAVTDSMGAVAGIVFDSIKSVIKVIASAFASGGTAVTPMEFFQNIVRMIEVVFISLRIAVEFVVEVIKTLLIGLGAVAVTAGEVIELAFKRDFKGAVARWKQGFTDLANIAQEGVNNTVKIAEKGKKDIDKALTGSFSEKGTAAGIIGKQGTKSAPEKDENAANRIALEKARSTAELNLIKENLKQAQAAYDDAYKNNLISLKEFYDAKLAIELKGIDEAIKEKKKEQEAIRNQGAGKNTQESLKLQTQMAKVVGELQVLEAQRYGAVVTNARAAANAERALAKALEETRIAGRKAAGIAEIDAETATAANLLALREITKEQELAIQRELTAKKLTIELQEIEEKRAIANGDLVVLAQLAEQEVNIRRSAAAQIVAIDRQMNIERRSASQSATDSIQSGLSSLIESVATGTKSLSRAFKDFIGSISASLAKLAADNIAKAIFSGGAPGAPGGGAGFGNILTTFFSSIFGGPKAMGGGVNSGTPYLVGERGPEMFVPKTSGDIIPNGAGGFTVNNSFTIAAPTDLRTQQQIAAKSGASVSKAMRRNK